MIDRIILLILIILSSLHPFPSRNRPVSNRPRNLLDLDLARVL